MPSAPNRRPSWNGGGSADPPAGSNRSAWVQLAAVFSGLAALAWWMPSPHSALDNLLGAHPAGATGVGDAAMLCLAAVSVWLLLAWMLLLTAVAVVGLLPGTLGSAARAGLVALAPAAMRNVLLTVVGASMVTGLAGCSTGLGTGPVAPPQSIGAAAVGTAGGTSVGAAAVGTAGVALAASGPASGTPGSATAASGSASGASDLASAASGSTSQLRAERLIGLATLRIADRIAVEGSAVLSAAAPAAGPAAPDVDWPADAPTSAPGTAAAPAPAPAPAPTSKSSTPARPAAPAISVDWPGPAARSATSSDTSVVVLRGDSLWAIAARSLPAGADDALIDRTWRAWYAANTSVIGSDPNHLLPGQILRPPTPGTGTPR